MSSLNELLKFVIPAGIILYGLYLIGTLLLDRRVRSQQDALVLPLRLQAYERLTLFLERISPNQLLPRLGGMVPTSLDFQQVLLTEIREEYNHNLAQQIYLSPEAWSLVTNAMNEVQALINQSAAEVAPDAPAIELSRRILEAVIQQNHQPTEPALRMLKEEVQRLIL